MIPVWLFPIFVFSDTMRWWNEIYQSAGCCATDHLAAVECGRDRWERRFNAAAAAAALIVERARDERAHRHHPTAAVELPRSRGQSNARRRRPAMVWVDWLPRQTTRGCTATAVATALSVSQAARLRLSGPAQLRSPSLACWWCIVGLTAGRSSVSRRPLHFDCSIAVNSLLRPSVSHRQHTHTHTHCYTVVVAAPPLPITSPSKLWIFFL